MKNLIKEYTAVAIGALAVAMGLNAFLVPVSISTGGVGGISTLLYRVADVPLWLTTIAVNALLFIFGFRILDKKTILKTVAGVAAVTVFLAITEKIPAFSKDELICSLYGGALVGAGVGLAVKAGASTGGSDFAALMLHLRLVHIPVARLILLLDIVIIAVSAVILSDYSVIFYSLISLIAASKVTDYIIVSAPFAKCLNIISDKYDEIAQNIMRDVERGVTGISVKGLYTEKSGTMLMCIVDKKQLPAVLSIIKSIDKKAFTVISDVNKVYGEGFFSALK